MAQIVKKEIVEPIEIKDTHGKVVRIFDEDMVKAIKDTVAKGATDSELFMFLSVADKYDLDPFLGEIYFAKFKDKKEGSDKSQILSSRNGFRKIAMREPEYKVHYSDYVCVNDEFKVTRKFGKLTDLEHTYSHTDRGALVGGYCVLETTDDRRYFFYAEFAKYNTGKNAWQSYPNDMIIKVAETRVFKSFANINGVEAEEAMPAEFSSEENVEMLDEGDPVEFIETEIKED